MTSLKNISILSVFVLAVTIAPACKSKKPLVQKPAVVEAPAKPVAPPQPVEEKKPEPMMSSHDPLPGPAVTIADKFENIQFEFNSAVLKTSSYVFLDKLAMALRANPTVKVSLNGYASAEGTDEHNLSLSNERANAVKTYLVNTGVSADVLSAKGFGEKNPISTNTDEASRAINRRVEIRKL